MTNIAPAPKAIELYNQLIALPGDCQGEIRRIRWNLRGEYMKNKRDWPTVVAYLQALAHSGEAEEAAEVADYVWGHEAQLPMDQRASLLTILGNIGQADRAYSLADSYIEAMGEATPGTVKATYLYSSILLGKLDSIATWAEMNEDGPDKQDAVDFLSQIKVQGLAEHFQNHMKIVNDILHRRYTIFNPRFLRDTDCGDVGLSCLYLAGNSREGCRELETEIDDALSSYYSNQGIDQYAYLPLITVNIARIEALWVAKTH